MQAIMERNWKGAKVDRESRQSLLFFLFIPHFSDFYLFFCLLARLSNSSVSWCCSWTNYHKKKRIKQKSEHINLYVRSWSVNAWEKNVLWCWCEFFCVWWKSITDSAWPIVEKKCSKKRVPLNDERVELQSEWLSEEKITRIRTTCWKGSGR